MLTSRAPPRRGVPRPPPPLPRADEPLGRLSCCRTGPLVTGPGPSQTVSYPAAREARRGPAHGLHPAATRAALTSSGPRVRSPGCHFYRRTVRRSRTPVFVSLSLVRDKRSCSVCRAAVSRRYGRRCTVPRCVLWRGVVFGNMTACAVCCGAVLCSVLWRPAMCCVARCCVRYCGGLCCVVWRGVVFGTAAACAVLCGAVLCSVLWRPVMCCVARCCVR